MSPPERQPARRHLVEHDAEREQVRPRIQLLRPAPVPATCTPTVPSVRPPRSSSIHRRPSGRPAPLAPRAPATAWPARSPGSWPAPRAVTKMFAGLMSRWMIPLRVRRLQTVRHLERQIDRSPPRAGPAPEPLLQRLALEQLHRDEVPAFMLVDVVDCADVRVIQRRGGPRLALEPLQRVAVPGQHLRAGTSGRPAARAGCPRPCRPHPSRRRRASRGSGSGRPSCRSPLAIPRSVNSERRSTYARVGGVSRKRGVGVPQEALRASAARERADARG